MSYAIQPPRVAAPAGPTGPPRSVTAATALLWAMAAAGLIYAVVTLVVAPGVVSRFRHALPPSQDPETYVSVVWLGAAVALVVAVILVALYAVLGVALRRGSNPARIAVLVLCVLGTLGGAMSALVVGAERGGAATPGSVGELLTAAYPHGWIGTNVALAVAQILAYAVVGALLLAAPRTFFGRPGRPPSTPPTYAVGPFRPAAYPGSPGGYPGWSGAPPTRYWDPAGSAGSTGTVAYPGQPPFPPPSAGPTAGGPQQQGYPPAPQPGHPVPWAQPGYPAATPGYPGGTQPGYPLGAQPGLPGGAQQPVGYPGAGDPWSYPGTPPAAPGAGFPGVGQLPVHPAPAEQAYVSHQPGGQPGPSPTPAQPAGTYAPPTTGPGPAGAGPVGGYAAPVGGVTPGVAGESADPSPPAAAEPGQTASPSAPVESPSESAPAPDDAEPPTGPAPGTGEEPWSRPSE